METTRQLRVMSLPQFPLALATPTRISGGVMPCGVLLPGRSL